MISGWMSTNSGMLYLSLMELDGRFVCSCLWPEFSKLEPWGNKMHMMTSSNGNIFRVTGPLCGEFTGDRWIPLTKASDVVNNREAGDLRRHRTHYDVIAMKDYWLVLNSFGPGISSMCHSDEIWRHRTWLYWLRWWLVAWRHQSITWTSIY